MRKTLSMMVGLLLFGAQLFAQNRVITGKITDDKNAPVGNASVIIKGRSVGTTTNPDGTFTLSIPTTAKTLVVSQVGMKEEEISLTTSGNYNVTLTPGQNQMEEVVVLGYGTGRKVGSVVGDIARVSGDRLQDRPAGNAFDALQGKVAGLQVLTSSGEPSASSSVRLHGTGSLGAGSTPLYILDGIPIDPGSVVSLNPQDFESVTVLKDASAASIYGSRAANGVIYITTKKGSSSKDPVITFQNQYAVSNLISTKTFENFMNTKELTDFQVATGYRRRGQIDTLLNQYPNDTKWYKTFYKNNAPTYQSNLSLSGGGGKTTYYISGGYFNQDGLAYRSGFNRYTMRSNITSTVNKWLKFGLNLSAGYDQRQLNQYGSNSLNRGIAMLTQPYYTPIDPLTQKEYDYIPGVLRYNPKYLADKLQNKTNNILANPTGYIQINPIANLTLKSQGGIEAFDNRTSSVNLPSYIGSLNNGSASELFSRGVTRTITNTAEYKFDIGEDHNFVALAGQEYIDYVNTTFSGSSAGQTDDRLILISAGPNNLNASSGKSEYSYLSYFGRLEYNFMDRYFVDASVRQDQSSRFGKDNRTARFWSVGGMWKVSEEKFFTGIKSLTNLVLRGSIGTSGNSAIGNYQSLAQVATNQYESQTGWNINTAGNPFLSWESQKIATLGVKFSLFDKANFDIEVYDRRTSNMLINVPYPYTSGFGSITSNVGTLQNKGIDVTVDYDIFRKKGTYLTPYLNFNYNKEKVTELFQGKQYWIIPNTGVSWAIGQPVSFFYPVFAQVNPQSGLPEWYLPSSDPNKIVDPTMDKSRVTNTFSTASLQQSTGIRRYAPFNGGFGLSGGFNGFYTQIDFSFSQGKYLINNDRYFFENPNQFTGYNQLKTVLDYWKQPGDVTTFPKYGIQFTQFDSRLIENASFIRMKAFTIGYNIPVLAKNRFIKSSKFYVTGRNLLTFTKYTGPDPEVDSNLTLGVNPNTRQVAVGLDFQF
ncbi:MAG: SusC/RagA family TonB-linked outer membrane protein [Chitinophagaceae bacterium]